MNEHGAGRKIDTKDITMIAVCTAIMAICSWIFIPATVPFTMQTFGVFLCVGLLGGRRGTLAVSVYLLLGAVGLPVFSGFTGGIGHLFGATGGYIIGFLFSALVMWLIEHLHGRSMKTLVLSMIAGLITCYAFGTVWFMLVYAKDSGSVGLMTALGWCVFPYVIPDAVKIALATALTRRLRPLISQ
ncbi:MAG: biotin transporter BioY [Clostridiales bacterium]|nr:biotin transporter BioY [Clostridiales bacterium]